MQSAQFNIHGAGTLHHAVERHNTQPYLKRMG